MRLLTSAVLLLVAGATVRGEPPGWAAGFAAVPITPARPMWMSGYASRTAPAEGAESELWAKAAVLRDAKGHTAVLVTLDLVGIDRDLSRAIRDAVGRKHSLSYQTIGLAVSHTHCGPVVGANLRAMYALAPDQAKLVDEYADGLKAKVLAAVDAAVARLEPATLTWATGRAGFAVNRRENKEAAVPGLRAAGALKGPVDHDVPVLAVRGAGGALMGVVFGYACHATVLSYQKWCGDYPGFAAAELEKAHPGAVALFAAGCGADQNPLPRRSVELAKEYGKRLAAAVEEVLAGPMPPLAPTFAGLYAEIDLPYATVPTKAQLEKERGGPDKLLAARAELALKYERDYGKLPASYPWYPVRTWVFGGELFWVNLGGEVTVDYARRLKRELGPGKTWVTAYANDVMAYIPSAKVLREGGYEGATSMLYYGLPSAWGERVEELVVEEVHRQAKVHRGR